MGLSDYLCACLMYCLFLQLIAFHRSLQVIPEMEKSPLASALAADAGMTDPGQHFGRNHSGNKTVCATAILSSTLALSLLRNSVSPAKSFVFSPYSLNTALSIVHDGASGKTQTELTELLLNGCSPSDVTDFYSSLALSIHSANDTGVAFKSASRFYLDYSISLKTAYQEHMESRYKVQVNNIDMTMGKNAAKTMNEFIEEATNGKITNVISPDDITPDTKAILINAIHFLGKWKIPFNPEHTRKMTFHGIKGDREENFMRKNHRFRVNIVEDSATALILPYKDEQYSFFYLLPHECTLSENINLDDGDCGSSLDQMRTGLTGERLVSILKEAQPRHAVIRVPKFKIESDLEGKEVLQKLGVKTLFKNANLSKISTAGLAVSRIIHKAMIEVDEKGAEAAAVTVVTASNRSGRPQPLVITVDRPFLFGIMRDDNILFLGQYSEAASISDYAHTTPVYSIYFTWSCSSSHIFVCFSMPSFDLFWQTNNFPDDNAAQLVQESPCPVQSKEGFNWAASIEKVGDQSMNFALKCDGIDVAEWECETEIKVRVFEGTAVVYEKNVSGSITFNQGSRIWKDCRLVSWRSLTHPTVGFYAGGELPVAVEFHIDLIRIEIASRPSASVDLSLFTSQNDVNNVNLLIGDTSITVSKDYLSFHSPVFKAMFSDKFEEKNKNEVPLKEVDYEEFLTLLMVIFPAGRVEVSDQNALSLAKVADQYHFENVSKLVENHLLQSTRFTVSEKLQIADEYRFSKLRDHFLRSITNVHELCIFKGSPIISELSDKTKNALLERMIELL